MITLPAAQNDEALWKLAKKRAELKSHLVAYIIVNIFLWGVWFFRSEMGYSAHHYPWPLFTTFGWGIGLAFHFADAYIFPKHNRVEKEYQKLKDKNNQA